MKKSLLSLSLIVSTILFNGCGGSDSPSDTTAPKFTNDVYEFTLDEGEQKVIELKTDDTTAKFSGPGVSGSTLTFTAPEVDNDMLYSVPITVTDGTNPVVKEFKFTVKDTDVITGTYEANASFVVGDDGAQLTADGQYFKDETGLLWRDAVTQPLSYDEASKVCSGKWRLPTRGEFLNLMNYKSGNGTDTLIRSELTDIVQANPDTSWVLKSGADLFVINHKGGVDTTIDADKNSTVVCVHGKPAPEHDIVQTSEGAKDNTTGLEWKKIAVAPNANTGGTSYGNHDFAKNHCTNPWKLPTINQLRSIRNGSTMSSLIAPTQPTNVYRIWSSTVLNYDSDKYYTINIKENSVVLTDDKNETHYVTCVK